MLDSIDAENTSVSKRKVEKLSLLKKQIRIRKKVLGQNIPIVFTHLRKQRPLNDIVKEISDFLDENSSEWSSYIQDPISMVGKKIHHRFEIDNTGEVEWYYGTIISYDATTKTHEIQYEGEEENSYFDLTIDLLNGDIRVLEL